MERGAGYLTARPIPRDVVAFTLVYMLVASIGALASGNLEFIFYILVMCALMGIVLLVHRRIGISRGVFWGLSTWGLAHMAGGLVPVPESWPTHGEIRVLYSWWLLPGLLKYDHIVHAYGFGVTTFLCWEGLRAIVIAHTERATVAPSAGMLLLCGAASMGFGALNEVVEFIATLTVPETNVGGYLNTGWDLLSNLIGVFIAAIWIRRSAS